MPNEGVSITVPPPVVLKITEEKSGVKVTDPRGAQDHGSLIGLADDDHSQYLLLGPTAVTRNILKPAGAFAGLLIRRWEDTPLGANQTLWAIENNTGTNTFVAFRFTDSSTPRMEYNTPLYMNDRNELRFFENTINGTSYVAFRAPSALSGNSTYSWPTALPAQSRILQCDATGQMTWVPSSASFGTIIVGEFATTVWNGVLTDYILAFIPIASSEAVYKNGLRLRRNTHYQIVSTQTLRFLAGSIPSALDVVLIDYRTLGA